MQPKIIKLSSQGFCFGVIRALKLAALAIKEDSPKPIYLIGSLVHNHFVNQYLKENSIIIKEKQDKSKVIDEIDSGTVIFTAHGIDKKIVGKAKAKGLTIIDATCPFVIKSFDLISEKINNGYDVLYLGKKGHPETEAALSLSPKVHLIESDTDLENLPKSFSKVALTNQTTMSLYDIEKIEKAVKAKYPNLESMDKVCHATRHRQIELGEVAKQSKKEQNVAFIIVGDPTSNNTLKLTETAREFSGHDVYQIEQIGDLPFDKLNSYKTIYLASGTSTPNAIVDEIYDFLQLGNYTKVKTKLKIDDYYK